MGTTLIDPRDVEHLGALAIAGALGFAGNWLAAVVRSRAGSLIGLAITGVILRITWKSWRTVRSHDPSSGHGATP